MIEVWMVTKFSDFEWNIIVTLEGRILSFKELVKALKCDPQPLLETLYNLQYFGWVSQTDDGDWLCSDRAVIHIHEGEVKKVRDES